MANQKDIGMKRSEVGDTPGVLDSIGLDNDFLQNLLGAFSLARYGVNEYDKYRLAVQSGQPGIQAPGFSSNSPVPSADIDQAQRSLSVALGSNKWGPILPTLLSLFSVDNPAMLNPKSHQATLDALDAAQQGPAHLASMGMPSAPPKMFGNPFGAGMGGASDMEYDISRWLMNMLGSAPDMSSVPQGPANASSSSMPHWSTMAIDALAQGGQPNQVMMPQQPDPISSFLQSLLR